MQATRRLSRCLGDLIDWPSSDESPSCRLMALLLDSPDALDQSSRGPSLPDYVCCLHLYLGCVCHQETGVLSRMIQFHFPSCR